ncbi:PREDICTED: FH1/FH2 domain-containing protein 3-like [Acromyrmex echinatior]|uniref:FH1/FH2 domain-containing protein 3-like n=1 Tax=Acromyrmex echinatior TaxID=103372 RepID=UPI000580BDCD|nr:PREDICTED: FH1/FH2 domain-containing protein 3-like [Acromyrmex echinatior]
MSGFSKVVLQLGQQFNLPNNVGKERNKNGEYNNNESDSNSNVKKKFFIIPYLNKVSERFQRLSHIHGFNTAYKPINKMNRFIKTGKDPLRKEDHRGGLQNCSNCSTPFFRGINRGPAEAQSQYQILKHPVHFVISITRVNQESPVEIPSECKLIATEVNHTPRQLSIRRSSLGSHIDSLLDILGQLNMRTIKKRGRLPYNRRSRRNPRPPTIAPAQSTVEQSTEISYSPTQPLDLTSSPVIDIQEILGYSPPPLEERFPPPPPLEQRFPPPLLEQRFPPPPPLEERFPPPPPYE